MGVGGMASLESGFRPGVFQGTTANFYNAIGGKASGGSVQAGQSYIVGENGPEKLTMGGPGYITPNSGMGGSLTVNVYQTNPSLQSREDFLNSIMPTLDRWARLRGLAA